MGNRGSPVSLILAPVAWVSPANCCRRPVNTSLTHRVLEIAETAIQGDFIRQDVEAVAP